MYPVITSVFSLAPGYMKTTWKNAPVGEPSDIPSPDDEAAGSDGESFSNDSNIKIDSGDCTVGWVRDPDCDMALEIVDVYYGARVQFEKEGNFTERGDGDDERVFEEMSVSDGSDGMQLLSRPYNPQQMPNDCDEIQAEEGSLPCNNLEDVVESGEGSLREGYYDQGAEDHEERYGEEVSSSEDDVDDEDEDDTASSYGDVDENCSDEIVEDADSDVDDISAQVFKFENASYYVKRSIGELVIDDSAGPGLVGSDDSENAASNAKKIRLEENFEEVVEVNVIGDNDLIAEIEQIHSYFEELRKKEALEELEREKKSEERSKRLDRAVEFMLRMEKEESLPQTPEKYEENEKEYDELKVELAMLEMAMEKTLENFYLHKNRNKHLEKEDVDEYERRGL